MLGRQAQLNALLDLDKGEAHAAPETEDRDTTTEASEGTVRKSNPASPYGKSNDAVRHERKGAIVAATLSAPIKKPLSPETKF